MDVRAYSDFQPVPFTVTRGRYLRRVEPLRAILEEDYFVKEVEEALEQILELEGRSSAA